MIEFFAVPPEEDEAFLAAFATVGAAPLFKALREDVRWRYASVDAAPPEGGVLLLMTGAQAHYEGRQGHLRTWTDGEVTAVHWSSPLMYQRAGAAARANYA